MASHEDIREFAAAVGMKCGYEVIDEQEESRVVLMMQQDGPERFLKIEEISPMQTGEFNAFTTASSTTTVVQHIPGAAQQVQDEELFPLKFPIAGSLLPK